MESTSISDVRRMCQCGAFRAYVQGGKVFLEDTATGQVVPLNGESGPANTERRAAPHREDRRGSRVERMFGARDTWKSADPDADQGPYRGFLIVQCEECGAIKAFCAKHETYGYKCGECGHETPLEKLRPLFIPEAIKLLKRERDALEDEYNGLGGLAMDGMPHSSAPGNPTEALAVRVIENGVKNRLQEIGVQVEVLEGDAANIRGALDAVNGKYKSVIIMRLIRGYSWTKISGKLGVTDSTARNWHGRAVERLGEVLEEVPMVDELAERATRART